MSLVRWNVEAQMVEVFDEEQHFLLHPYLEVAGWWTNSKRLLEERGYSLPTSEQLFTCRNLIREVNDIIVLHFGSQLKEDWWHWTRKGPTRYGYEAVYLHNRLCRDDMEVSGRYIGRAVLDLNK